MSATAATVENHILMFSNEDYTSAGQPGREDDQTFAALGTTGATVTRFDGGDGSAAAWTAALANVDVLVFPESDAIYEPGGSSVMSDDAAAVVKAWLSAGHTAFGTGGYSHLGLVNYFTGLDYSDVWGTGGTETWNLQNTNPDLPATLPNVNASDGLNQFDDWSTALSAPVTPIYLSADATNLGIGSFAVGTGAFVYVAYDFYPDPDDIDSGNTALWISALATLVDEAIPAAVVTPVVPVAVVTPALAATGADLTGSALGAAGLLAVGAVLMLVIARRKKTATV